MKNITKFFALAVVILGFSATSFGQPGVATLTATATVFAVADVTPGLNLNFGSIGSDAGGTVTMSTEGERDAIGATLLLAEPGNAGDFTIEGTVGVAVNLTMPTEINITEPGGDFMTVGDFVFDIGAGGVGINGVLMPALGEVNVKIGATLSLEAGQTVGTYTGTYEITIALP